MLSNWGQRTHTHWKEITYHKPITTTSSEASVETSGWIITCSDCDQTSVVWDQGCRCNELRNTHWTVISVSSLLVSSPVRWILPCDLTPSFYKEPRCVQSSHQPSADSNHTVLSLTSFIMCDQWQLCTTAAAQSWCLKCMIIFVIFSENTTEQGNITMICTGTLECARQSPACSLLIWMAWEQCADSALTDYFYFYYYRIKLWQYKDQFYSVCDTVAAWVCLLLSIKWSIRFSFKSNMRLESWRVRFMVKLLLFENVCRYFKLKCCM